MNSITSSEDGEGNTIGSSQFGYHGGEDEYNNNDNNNNNTINNFIQERKQRQHEDYNNNDNTDTISLYNSKLLNYDVDPTNLYELLTCEGKGSFGAVYKALRKTDATIVAVKVIQVTSSDEVDSIHGEITMLRECNHVNITMYTGAYLYNQTLWIVMEYCGGGSISDILKHFPLKEKDIALVAREVMKGLVYLHSREQLKIHRDIKGANILLTDKGEVKLADFGVSKQLQETIAKANTFVGTPYWMAPEVLTGIKYDGKADVWSVAITCIEMAEKLPPLNDVHPMRVIMMIPQNTPPTLQEEEKWSDKFKHFLKSCLVKDPLHRISSRESLNHKFLSRENCSTAEELMMNVHRRLALEKIQGAPERRRRRRAALQGPRRGGTGASTINTTTTTTTTGKAVDDTRTDNNSALLKEWDKIKAATTTISGSGVGISSKLIGLEISDDIRGKKKQKNIDTIVEEDDDYESDNDGDNGKDEKKLNNTGTFISKKVIVDVDGNNDGQDDNNNGKKTGKKNDNEKDDSLLDDGNVNNKLTKEEEKKEEEEEDVLLDASLYVMDFIRSMEGDLS